MMMIKLIPLMGVSIGISARMTGDDVIEDGIREGDIVEAV